MRLALFLLLAAACARAGGGTEIDASQTGGDAAKPIDAAIDGNGCTTQPCTILPQCGCGGANSCDVDTMDNMGTACRPVATPGQENASCNSLDDCDKGYLCVGSPSFASCKKYCSANADCGSPRGQCVIDISSGGQPIAGIPPVCSSNCDPTSTNPPECPSNAKCGMFSATHNSTQYDISDCALAGSLVQGGDCKSGTTGNDALCAKGFLCTTTDSGTTFKCRKICKNPMANSAACGGQTCIAFTDPFQLAGETYGVCAP